MQLPKTYQPHEHESRIYDLWESSGAFAPSDSAKEPFTVIMPPPNANGNLHWGHATGYTIEDIIVRFKRMNGFKVLWLPGTDHAGIETQFVYERDVLAPEGKTRFDLGPDKFYEQVLEYTRKSGDAVIEQFRSMGFSADWSRLKFTLDEDIVDIVYDTFQQLHQDGHVYRGNRIVNWCTRCQAAFADIELDRQEQKDTLYTVDYGRVRIATVRPETIFADVAIAVHPEDERYKDMIGTYARIPLADRDIPIIADKHVDPEFGTGALKITPGHDQADYEIGLRHELPEISVIDTDGKLVNVPQQFAGLDVEEGRGKVAEALKQAKSLIDKSSYEHTVSVHDRCGSTIEPLISEQWFLRIKDLNRPVIEAIEKDEIEFHPPRFKRIALDWLKQEHDWCISRQIWWGIRIPVFYKTSHDPEKDNYIIARSENEAKEYYGEGNYREETDTFDTWFSSGQWPYATLMTTSDFSDFYPTSLMGTAREILHKWVTRMIMFGLYKTGEVPFKEVYLWGMVTDEHGQKMSKSKGNVIDPMLITDKYGTDALRLAGAASNTPGNDSPMSERKVEAMRNFCNKLWNVARFVLDQTEAAYTPKGPEPANLADEWLLSRLHQRRDEITRLIEGYRLNEAAESVYHLLWSDFADWYIEASKADLNLDTLVYGLETTLRLAHPFAPFVTEAIWQQLPWRQDLLITATWPQAGKADQQALADFSELQTVITEIRSLVTELGIAKPTLYHTDEALLSDNAGLLDQLAPISGCQAVSDGYGLPIPGTTLTCWLGVDEQTVEQYQGQLQQSLEETNRYIHSLQAKLDNHGFTHNAPKEVVKDTKQRLEDAQKRSQTLSEQLEQLGREQG